MAFECLHLGSLLKIFIGIGYPVDSKVDFGSFELCTSFSRFCIILGKGEAEKIN